jgi:catechol 2,3-dioxygenase-like lactoylglutathione lyase family enzyme
MLAPLNRIIIFVGDVQKCAGFFRDAFGFTVVPSVSPASEWIELETGGCRLAFHQAHGPNGPIQSPTGGPMNPHKIVFYTEDVATAREELMAKGAPMGDVVTFGAVTVCDGQDPEGHVFQICNRR